MRFLTPLLFVLCTAMTVPATAQSTAPAAANPYEASVGVSDQSTASRDRGLREALAQVVVRVSGPSAPSTAAGLIARAPQYVSRYGFQRDPAGALQLVAAFDRSALDTQLRALGLPVWGYAAAPPEDLRLRISGVRDARGYSRALTALRAVPGVQNLNVEAFETDHIDLLVRAEGGRGRIVPALLASRQFAEIATGGAAFTQLQLLQ